MKHNKHLIIHWTIECNFFPTLTRRHSFFSFNSLQKIFSFFFFQFYSFFSFLCPLINSFIHWISSSLLLFFFFFYFPSWWIFSFLRLRPRLSIDQRWLILFYPPTGERKGKKWLYTWERIECRRKKIRKWFVFDEIEIWFHYDNMKSNGNLEIIFSNVTEKKIIISTNPLKVPPPSFEKKMNMKFCFSFVCAEDTLGGVARNLNVGGGSAPRLCSFDLWGLEIRDYYTSSKWILLNLQVWCLT